MTYPLTLDRDQKLIRDANRKLVAYCFDGLTIETIFRVLNGERVPLALPLRRCQVAGLDASILDAVGQVVCYCGMDDAWDIIERLSVR